MSQTVQRRPITEPVDERPSFSARHVREVGTRELAIRFGAGALTSVVAGAVTLAFGAWVGGILLAFPAILAASLTLIEREEDPTEAREDARGAVVGGFAMAVFAAIGAITLGHVNPAIALALATVGWFAVAIGGYWVAWLR